MTEKFKVGDIIGIEDVPSVGGKTVYAKIIEIRQTPVTELCFWKALLTEDGQKVGGEGGTPTSFVFKADKDIKERIKHYKNIIKELKSLCQK